MQWSGLERKTAPGLADDGAFDLITGRYPIDRHDRAAFLEAIGGARCF